MANPLLQIRLAQSILLEAQTFSLAKRPYLAATAWPVARTPRSFSIGEDGGDISTCQAMLKAHNLLSTRELCWLEGHALGDRTQQSRRSFASLN